MLDSTCILPYSHGMLRYEKQFNSARAEFESYGFSCEIWTPSRMPRPDRHNEIEINLLESGTLTYLFGGQYVTIEASKLAVFWAAIPHQIVSFDNKVPYFVVTLPLNEFVVTELEPGVVKRILCGKLLTESISDDCDKLKFRQWEKELRNNSPEGERAVHLEVQARLLRFSHRISNQTTMRHPGPELSKADQIACYIARNYREHLSSRSIAEAIGLHPNYAMNIFRKAFNTTITTFITQHRISHAQRLLITTNESILAIAFDVGFQSLSRFNEAFKATCGCPPRDYRKTHRTKFISKISQN